MRRSSSSPGWQRLPCAAPHLTAFVREAGLALYSSLSDGLYGLEGLAAAWLLRLDGGESPEALLAEGADRPGEARPLVARLADLLAGREAARGTPYCPPFAYPRELPAGPLAGGRYRVLGADFLLRSPCGDLLGQLDRPLRHLARPAGTPDVVIDLEPAGGLIRVRFNGLTTHPGLGAARLYPYLQDWMRIAAYQRQPYLLALHSAAVARGGRCLLLPGATGAGKSTLCAALLAAGWRLLSDETAVLDEGDLGVYPVPLALGQKAGSWPLLADRFPELARAPTHERFDGQPVRYLAPEPAALPEDRRLPAAAVVFPRFDPGARLSLTPLTPIQTLAGLAAAGYQVRDRLGLDKAEKILDWLCRVPGYRLAYPAGDEAVAALRGLP